MPVLSATAQQALEALAGRLREIRRDAELTARQVAQAAGWHESKCSRIENARTVPSPADIRTWCTVCGVPGQAADLTAALRAIDSMYVEWRRQVPAGMRRPSTRVAVTSRKVAECYVSSSPRGDHESAVPIGSQVITDHVSPDLRCGSGEKVRA